MATYYVDPVSGNDGSAGTATGTAWKTTQKAADTAVAGDTVRLMTTGIESVTAAIDMDTNAGSSGSYITFEAADGSGNALTDGTQYEIKATGAIATGILNYTATSDFTRWRFVKFNGNGNAASAVYNNVDASDSHWFRGCRMTGCTSHGITVRGTVDQGWTFVACEIDTNGGSGFQTNTANRASARFIGCAVHNNTSLGLDLNRTLCSVSECQVYANGADGIRLGASCTGNNVIGNTVYGNTGDGFDFNASSIPTLTLVGNSSSGSTGGYGYNFNATATSAMVNFNHAFNNASGAADITLPGSGNVTADPLFVAAGSGNLALGSASPLIAAGPSGIDIGAKGRAAGATTGGHWIGG